MQKGSLTIFQCFKNTKKLPTWDWYHEFLESPSGKLQIRTTIGWSLELVHLSGSGPWTIKQVLAFILFQLMINIVVFVVEGHSRSWRSAYFLTQENKRLPDHVVERIKSPTLISCSQSCLQNAWCSSANFVMSSKNGKGTCELNRHERSLFDANSKLHDQQDVIFAMILKVI